jgi:hypothetical protein
VVLSLFHYYRYWSNFEDGGSSLSLDSVVYLIIRGPSHNFGNTLRGWKYNWDRRTTTLSRVQKLFVSLVIRYIGYYEFIEIKEASSLWQHIPPKLFLL